jgi:hypothetical protein
MIARKVFDAPRLRIWLPRTLYPLVRIAGLFLRTLGKGRVRDQRTSSELAQPMAGADGRSRKIRYLRRRETAITYCADALYHTLGSIGVYGR